MSIKDKLLDTIELFEQYQAEQEITDRLVHISNKIGFTIPLEVEKIISLHAEFNDPDLFSVFDVDIYSIDELESQYNNLNDDYSFFGYFGVDQRFNIDSSHEVLYFQTIYVEPETPRERIENLAHIFPIGQSSGGDFFAVDLLSGCLVSVEVGGTSLIYRAPSITEHLQDLAFGVEKGFYNFDYDGELEYKREWNDRVHSINIGKNA